MRFRIWPSSRPDMTRHLVVARALRGQSMARLWRRFINAATRALEAVDRERRRRRAVLALQSLDDRLLRDLGIQRDQIAHVVEHGAVRSNVEQASTAVWPSSSQGAADITAIAGDLRKAA